MNRARLVNLGDTEIENLLLNPSDSESDRGGNDSEEESDNNLDIPECDSDSEESESEGPIPISSTAIGPCSTLQHLDFSDHEVEEASDFPSFRSCSDNPSQIINTFTGKNNFAWFDTPVMSGRRVTNNIIRDSLSENYHPCLSGSQDIDIFKRLFDASMFQLILRYTNLKIREARQKYQGCSYTNDVDLIELEALIGLLYYTAIYRTSHTNLIDLWSTDGTGIDIFRATMSRQRFEFLINCLRFDDKETRKDRLKNDKLACISELWNKFDEKCRQYYKPGYNLTIDEMLRGFRGRVSFKQFIPNKPAKYGIKIFILADSKTNYCLRSLIYSGQGTIDNQPLSAEKLVKFLLIGYENTGRNITMDNWFTSIPLCKDVEQIKSDISFQFSHLVQGNSP